MDSEKFNKWLFNPVLLNEETVVELRELTEIYPWFQLAWVLFAKNLKQIHSPDYDTLLKKVAIRVNNRKLLFNFLNTQNMSLHIPLETGNSFSLTEEGNEKSISGDSLIDRFLSSDKGSIRRNSNETKPVENDGHSEVLERSSAENDELITETLANIYLQQKNYEKAIHAFEKLSLKYPEKSVYFASRIKETEDLKNSK